MYRRPIGTGTPVGIKRPTTSNGSAKKSTGHQTTSSQSTGSQSGRSQSAGYQNVTSQTTGSPRRAVYSVMWRKKTLKVHKTWEGDGEGFVVPSKTGNGHIFVVKADGLTLGSVNIDFARQGLEEGQILASSRFEFEVGSLLSSSHDAAASSSSAQSGPNSTDALQLANGFKLRKHSGLSTAEPADVTGSSTNRNVKSVTSQVNTETLSTPPNSRLPVPALERTSCNSEAKKINKRLPYPSLGMAPRVGSLGPPLKLDPFVTLRPSSFVAKRHKGSTGDSADVATDQSLEINAALMQKLRPHQIDAVKFLYDAVTGKRHVYGNGAILADEMGLGKTLVAITLIDALLKSRQIRHALVVCPVTLISNWKAEFQKWLPSSMLGVMVVDQRGLGNGSLKDPARAFFGDRSFKVHQVMIIGYERTRLIASRLVDDDKQFDLVVCDEGHKLKTSGSKTAEAIASIVGEKRVLLTGTPIQNNLNEFWSLADFVNPGVFGTEAQFNRRFTLPVEAGDYGKSHAALDELSEIGDEFMLRRDASELAKYLSVPKTEYAIFCRPSAPQNQLYATLAEKSCHLVEAGSGAYDQGAVLQAITSLKKAASGLDVQGGGKIAFLKELVLATIKKTGEKMVIVSGSTKVLDMCQELCATVRAQWLRLDGQTPQERRQGMVNKFNRQPADVAAIFLLSSRSGGMGLNLVGGSRLVLVDCDWNPSVDAQAMARIHRDGQTRACHIYRLMLAGTIDEKIFQRQLSKIGLSNNVFAESADASKRLSTQFTRDQLQDLFTFSRPARCNTLDILMNSESLKGYTQCDETDDEVLNAAIRASKNVSCVLAKN